MRKSPTHSLLFRLLLAFFVPTLTLFAVFGWMVYRVAEQSLEESLGRRLTDIAQAAAAQIRPEAVMFLSPGDDRSRTAVRLNHKLAHLMQRTHVARIFILDQQLRSRSDTKRSVQIGDPHYQAEAHRSELDVVFAKGEASSMLFTGHDGKMYKTGYAPVLHEDKAVAAIGVEGSAEFYQVLNQLRNYLFLSGAIVALLVMLASILLARRITRPLRTLAREASRIGSGDLKRPITVEGEDEVGLLAETMNEMREGLFQRDQVMQLMLSGIAHEVRNPLGGIELFSGILREDLQGDEEKLEHLGRIDRELNYLKKVVNDFLDYARHVPTAFSRVDLAATIAEVSELLAGDADARQVQLRQECPAAVRVSCDREQLRRVIINITRNGIQAAGDGGTVTLRCG